MCHCLACQRRTGSAFGIQARFAGEHVVIEGRSAVFVRVGDSGGRASLHFCPECGSTVYYEADWMPGYVAIPVGAFAEPGFPPPTISVYESRRHGWVVTPDSIVEHLDD
jgi:hypothetical protein